MKGYTWNVLYNLSQLREANIIYLFPHGRISNAINDCFHLCKSFTIARTKVSYGDSRAARPVIGGQSQGVEWAKGTKGENGDETRGGRELAKVSFSDICGQHTWRRKLAWVSRLEPFAVDSASPRYI